MFEVIETLGRVYLVTEWIRGGELYNHITQGGPLREIHAAPLYKQLLLAVKHMVSGNLDNDTTYTALLSAFKCENNKKKKII